jgi:hypothetical protein
MFPLITCLGFEYFSLSVGCLFILSTVSSPVPFSKLMQSQFSVLGFVAMLWGSYTKKIAQPNVRENCSCFCSDTFTVSGPRLIFIYMV